MVKAFKVTFTELEDMLSSGDHENDEEEENDSEVDWSDDDLIEQVNISSSNRMSCFAHTLQLTVKDGIDSSKQITFILSKASWRPYIRNS